MDGKEWVIVVLSSIIVVLLLFNYLSNRPQQKVVAYLSMIYENRRSLMERYGTFLHPSPIIKKKHNIIIMENVLNERFFQFLQDQVIHSSYRYKSKQFLNQRKGTGVDFFSLLYDERYRGFLELYFSTELLDLISKVYQAPIQRVALNSSDICSLLIYTEPGDHIGWHKDFSHYHGNRYIALLTLVNEHQQTKMLSANRFMYRYDGKEYSYALPPNSLILFKGSEIWHQSTAIAEKERRILLSMTFCDTCQEKKNIFYDIYNYAKKKVLYN